MQHVDLLIIGGGAAGMAAALSAERKGVKNILIVEREKVLGGILPQCIHSGFGKGYFGVDMTGPEYSKRFTDKMKTSKVIVYLNTTVLNLQPDKSALLSSEIGLRKITYDHVILATGARETPMGALPICGTRPSGIFTAGQAQRMVNIDKHDIGNTIVILGSGDIGLIMARRFTLLGKKVIAVIEKQSVCSGLPRNIEQCINAYGIPVKTLSTVTKVHGNRRICGVTVRNLESEKEDVIPCDTLLIAVGLIPERELLDVFGSSNEIKPDWISLCGNCDTIHQIVDGVSYQAEQIATQAASILL